MADTLDSGYLEYRQNQIDKQSRAMRLLKEREEREKLEPFRGLKPEGVASTTEPGPSPKGEVPLGDTAAELKAKDATLKLPVPEIIGDEETEVGLIQKRLFDRQNHSGESTDIVPTPPEIGLAMIGGARDAVVNTLDIFKDFDVFAEEKGRDFVGTISQALGLGDIQDPEEGTFLDTLQRISPQGLGATPGEVFHKLAETIPEVKDPDSVIGKFIRTTVQFTLPFMFLLGKTKQVPVIAQLIEQGGTQMLKGEVAAAILAGLPTDFLVFDPKEPRLANMLYEMHPAFRNPLIEYLKAPEGDIPLADRIDERVKNAIEGAGMGVLFDGFLVAARGLKKSRFANKILKALNEAEFGKGPRGFYTPDFDLKFNVPSDAKKIAQLTAKHQGATYNFVNGNLAGQEAFAVSIFPELSRPVPGIATKAQIKDYILRMAEVVPMDHPNISVGTWFSDGQTILDVVVTPSKLETAMALGKRYNQEAIFDLKTLQEIRVGGTGLDPGNLPPIAKRIKDATRGRFVLNPSSIRGRFRTLREEAKVRLESIVKDEQGRLAVGEPRGEGISKETFDKITNIGASIIADGVHDKEQFGIKLFEEMDFVGLSRLGHVDIDRIFEKSQQVYHRHMTAFVKANEEAHAGTRLHDPASELFDFGLPKAAKAQTGFPDVEKVLYLFKKGEFRKDWYDGARELLQKSFGEDADLMADIISALSIQAKVELNIKNAVKAYSHFKQHGTFEGLPDWYFAFGRGTQLKKIERRLPLDSPKLKNFAAALKGDESAVVVDRWINRLVFGKEKITPKQSEFIQAYVTRFAHKHNVSPVEAQSAMWVGAKMAQEMLSHTDPSLKPVRELLLNSFHKANLQGQLFAPKELSKNQALMMAAMLAFSDMAATSMFRGTDFNSELEGKAELAGFFRGVGREGVKTLFERLKTIFKSAPKPHAPRPKPRAHPRGVPNTAGELSEEVVKSALVPDSLDSIARQYEQLIVEARRGIRKRPVQEADAEIIKHTMTPEKIRALFPGTTINDAEIIAMTDIMSDMGHKLIALAQKAQAEGFSDESINDVLTQLWVFGRTDPKRLGVRAEAGRSLAAFEHDTSAKTEFLEQFGAILRDSTKGVSKKRVIEAILKLETPEQLAMLAKQTKLSKFGDVFFEVWINSLLFGPKTFMVNMMSNASFLAWNIAERGVASGIGAARGAGFSHEPTAMIRGVAESITDAWRTAWKILIKEGEMPEEAFTKLEVPTKAITAEAFNKTGVMGRFLDYLGYVIRTPGRGLMAGDELFKGMSYRAQLHAVAAREAKETILKEGLTGKKAADLYREVYSNVLAEPPASAVREAKQFAQYATFTQELPKTFQKLQEFQRTPLGRLVIPFLRTPINIFKAGVERTGPLGLAIKGLKEEFKQGGAVRDLAIAKVAMSSAMFAMFVKLAAEGKITGEAPKDKRLREGYYGAGLQPYSFWIDHNKNGEIDRNEMVAFNRFEPLGMVMGFAANLGNAAGHMSEAEFQEKAEIVVAAFAKNMTSKTFIRGVAEAANLFSDPDRYGEYVTNDFAGTLVPFASLLRQTEQAIDPTMREPGPGLWGWMEGILEDIPGFSTTVEPSLDLFGNERLLGGGLGRGLVGPAFRPLIDTVSPIYINSAPKKHRKIFKEIFDSNLQVPSPPAQIEGIELRPNEVNAIIRLAASEKAGGGMALDEELKELFKTEFWKNGTVGPDGSRDFLLRSRITRRYKRAIALYLSPDGDADEDLKEGTRKAKINKLKNRAGIKVGE